MTFPNPRPVYRHHATLPELHYPPQPLNPMILPPMLPYPAPRHVPYPIYWEHNEPFRRGYPRRESFHGTSFTLHGNRPERDDPMLHAEQSRKLGQPISQQFQECSDLEYANEHEWAEEGGRRFYGPPSSCQSEWGSVDGEDGEPVHGYAETIVDGDEDKRIEGTSCRSAVHANEDKEVYTQHRGTAVSPPTFGNDGAALAARWAAIEACEAALNYREKTLTLAEAELHWREVELERRERKVAQQKELLRTRRFYSTRGHFTPENHMYGFSGCS